MAQYISNNNNSFNVSNVSNNYTVTDVRSEILTWLSPLEPRIRHQDIGSLRLDNVGDWLLQGEQFRRWCDSTSQDEADRATLFCYGDPGVGKTYISSLVIDTLCHRARRKDVAVACVYFDYAARKEQTPMNVLGALLKQVVGGLQEIPDEIVKAFEAQKRVIGGQGLKLPEMVKMLQNTCSLQPTFLCLDALDECAVEHRREILDSLQQILQKSPTTRMFLTGRSHVGREVERYFAGRATIIPIKTNKDDIIRFIRASLKNDPNPDEMNSSLKEEILKSISETISEIFLLVSLNVEAILQEPTIYLRRQRLKSITAGVGLEDVYKATVDRVKAQSEGKSRLGMAALMWICHSERQLRVDELCHALAVEVGSTDFNAENVPSIWTLLGCCQGLVVLDKESSIVRLVHFTLKEYLSAHAGVFDRAHSLMAETCLTYLLSQQVRSLPTYVEPNPNRQPLLQYCSVYWGTHAKRELSNCAGLLALKLLHLYDSRDSHISARLVFRQQHMHLTFIVYLWFSSLHCACYFGIVEIVTLLIEQESCDINQTDSMNTSPLALASMHGHERVVVLLLKREDIKPDPRDGRNKTPLMWATDNGHEKVVKLLLERKDVNPNSQDSVGNTPLVLAAWRGDDKVTKALLERKDVNPNSGGILGITPLSLAARRGDDRVTKALLEREDIDPNFETGVLSPPPLSAAASSGHEGVVKLLLQREDIDPDKVCWEVSQTPLQLARQNGHQGIVELLLAWKRKTPSPA